MDRAIFVAMKGLQNCAFALTSSANNIANADTVGYKSEEFILRQALLNNGSNQTRVYGTSSQIFTDARVGPLMPTGGNLDVSIGGSDAEHIGFIAVQGKDGQEHYTRNGSLAVNKDGLLVTDRGELVLGARGGIISLANAVHINISEDGTVNGLERGGDNIQVNFGQMKLVEGPSIGVQKTEDGLHRARENATIAPSPNVELHVGSLEGSNVNPMRELTKLIDISRSYEMQTQAIKSIQKYSSDSNKLLDTTN